MWHGLMLIFLFIAAIIFLIFIAMIWSHQTRYSMDFYLLPCLWQGSLWHLTAFLRSFFLPFLIILHLFPKSWLFTWRDMLMRIGKHLVFLLLPLSCIHFSSLLKPELPSMSHRYRTVSWFWLVQSYFFSY